MSDTGYTLEPPPSDEPHEQTPVSRPPDAVPDAPVEQEAAPDAPEAPSEPEEQPKRRTLVNDLQDERAARRQAEEQAQRAQAEAAQMRPIMQALASHPNGVAILQSLVQGRPVPQQGPDPELTAIAEDLGLYNVDGTPDLVKAGRVAQRQQQIAQRAVEQAVQPLQQTTEHEQAQAGRNALWQQAHQPTNQHVDVGVLGDLLKLLPDNLIKHQEVQSMVWVLATGATTLQGGKGRVGQPPAPAPNGQAAPPVFTEQAGGRTRPQTQLAAPFKQLLQKAGMSDKDVQSSLNKYVPGSPNSLE